MNRTPPADAIYITSTCKRYEHDDVPEEYAVRLATGDDPIVGGCVIWGRYEGSWRPPGGEWHINAPARGLVHALIAQLAEQKRLNVALAERCAGQSELLTKRAAKPTEPT